MRVKAKITYLLCLQTKFGGHSSGPPEAPVNTRSPWIPRDIVKVVVLTRASNGPFEVRFPGLICRAFNNSIPNGRFLFFVGKKLFFYTFARLAAVVPTAS